MLYFILRRLIYILNIYIYIYIYIYINSLYIYIYSIYIYIYRERERERERERDKLYIYYIFYTGKYRLLRSSPSEKEWRTPWYTVPVSPQCHEEISLPTLPRTVFQGAAISSEHTSQFLPPGNVAELRCLSPLPFSCRGAIPGHPTSRSDYTRGQFPETGSLSRHLAV